MKKNELKKMAKTAKTEKVETPVKVADAVVTVANAPSLTVTKATDRGVTCVVRNVRLTWVFVTSYREDKNDWRKGVKSVTLLIPKKGAGPFQRALADAVKQCLALNRVIVDKQDKIDAFQIATAVNEEGSLLKDGDQSADPAGNPREELQGHLTWQVKKTSYRESKNEEFTDKFPLVFQDAAGRVVEAAFIDREFYSGVYADVALTLAAYDVSGNKGITAYLNGLRKVRDGERLGAANPFASVPVSAESVDALDYL